MRTLLKYAKNAVVAYLHETDMPIVERDVKPEPHRTAISLSEAELALIAAGKHMPPGRLQLPIQVCDAVTPH